MIVREDSAGERTERSKCCWTQSVEGLCRSGMWGSSLQPQSDPEEGSRAIKDILALLHSTSSKI